VHNWNPDPGAAVGVEYDESGNMVVKGSDILVWDADNRLHTYDTATGTDTGMVYDVDGNRILRVHGSTTTTYIGGVYETDGTTTTSYYSFAGDTVGFREHTTTSDDRFYMTGDHLGSTATVIDASDVGNPVDQYYYPYGEPRTSWAIDTDRAYTGQISDHDQTGFYHYNARYYDPQISRFISSDTIIPNPANPQTLNRYSYVGNNPVTYTDPSGHAYDLPGECPGGWSNGVCDQPGYPARGYVSLTREQQHQVIGSGHLSWQLFNQVDYGLARYFLDQSYEACRSRYVSCLDDAAATNPTIDELAHGAAGLRYAAYSGTGVEPHARATSGVQLPSLQASATGCFGLLPFCVALAVDESGFKLGLGGGFAIGGSLSFGSPTEADATLSASVPYIPVAANWDYDRQYGLSDPSGSPGVRLGPQALIGIYVINWFGQ